MPPLLEALRLTKSYHAGLGRCWARVQVLRAVSLVVEAGERVAVIGAAGAGKTTLLHCLTGLRRTDAGTVRWQAGAGPPYRVCAEPADLLRGGRALALADLPDEGRRSVQWIEILHANGAARGGWLVLARRAALLTDLADRTLVLADGCLREPPRCRSRRVAERMVAGPAR